VLLGLCLLRLARPGNQQAPVDPLGLHCTCANIPAPTAASVCESKWCDLNSLLIPRPPRLHRHRSWLSAFRCANPSPRCLPTLLRRRPVWPHFPPPPLPACTPAMPRRYRHPCRRPSPAGMPTRVWINRLGPPPRPRLSL
jgi:hypothetical protein